MAQKQKYMSPVGRAKYPHLNIPDAAFDAANPKYKTEIVMSKDEAKDFVRSVKEAVEQEFGANKKNIRLPYTVDDETGEVSVKVQSQFLPKFFDTAGNPIVPSALPRINGGSLIRAGGIFNLYTVSGTSGLSLMLDKVQVVEVSSGFSGDDDGFDAIEGSFTIDAAMDAVEVDTSVKTGVTADDFDF